MPPVVIELIAAVVGEVFRQILLNLPALGAGLREITTSSATEALADPDLSRALDDELTKAIAAGQVGAP